jgi:hypothetical protein
MQIEKNRPNSCYKVSEKEIDDKEESTRALKS